MKIRNLTNSPYDLQSTDGPVRLPAFGEVEGEFAGAYVELLAASRAVEIVDGEPVKRDPLDHDGDGRRGGSLPGDQSTRARGRRKAKG